MNEISRFKWYQEKTGIKKKDKHIWTAASRKNRCPINIIGVRTMNWDNMNRYHCLCKVTWGISSHLRTKAAWIIMFKWLMIVEFKISLCNVWPRLCFVSVQTLPVDYFALILRHEVTADSPPSVPCILPRRSAVSRLACYLEFMNWLLVDWHINALYTCLSGQS